MTSITWKNDKTGKTSVQILNSKDRLETELQLLKYDKKKRCYFKEVKNGKNIDVLSVQGVSYDSEVEKEIFRRANLIPKKEDYPDGN